MTMPFFSPEVTERYTPIKVLGYGAFASVIQAQDVRNDRIVAIKHFVTPGGKQHQFFRELRVILQLNHPHIVQCLDMFSTDEEASDLIFEYADGGSLRDHLELGHGWPPQRALDVLLDVCHGLIYAHEQGVVHRDLKPENILCFGAGASQTYKIADFGISKFIGTSGKTTTSVGSPVYMAPEQFYDRYDLKSDIYALGVLFFELLHSRLPFEGSHAEIFKGHLEAPVPIGRSIPQPIADLVTSMMAKQPGDRPTASGLLETVSKMVQEAGGMRPEPMPEAVPKQALEPTPPTSVSGETLFTDMFGDARDGSQGVSPSGSRNGDTNALDEETSSLMQSGDSDQSKPPLPAQDSASKSSALFFGEEFGDAVPDVLEAVETPIQAQADRPGASSSTSSNNIFGEGFDDAPALDAPQDVMRPNTPIQFGNLQATLLWTRAADTKSIRLANLDDGQNLLMIAKTGVYELTSKASKGKTYYQGALDGIGTPSRGILPLLAGDTVMSLQSGHADVSTWAAKANLAQVCFAPGGKAAATVVDQTVYYHNHEGTLCWSGDFGSDATGLFVYFETSGYLGVMAYDSDDQGIYLYAYNGNLISQQKMPGRILSATRDLILPGIWVTVEIDGQPHILHVDPVGQSTQPKPIEPSLRGLVGSRNWVCGTDPNGTLHVVDPGLGRSVPITLEGQIIDYEHGVEDELLYVLESRHDLLKYISVFSIDLS